MSRGTPNSAKAPASITNAAGSRVAPEKYPLKNHRVSNTPGAMNKTRVATSRTSGSVAKAPRRGPTTAKAAAPESATPASNHRKRAQALPTIPPPRVENFPGGCVSPEPCCRHLRRRGAHASRTFPSPSQRAPVVEAEGHPVSGLSALEVPSTRPEPSLASTPTYASSPLFTLMAVSNPSLGTDGPTASSLSGLGPPTTCQLATSVAPFQLAYRVSSSSGVSPGSATSAGSSVGYPFHGKRKAR